jgi:pyridoxine 4-dehydrogenase
MHVCPSSTRPVVCSITGIPLADQLDAPVELQAEGKYGRLEFSDVTVPEFGAAQAITRIANIQNLYNVSDRRDELVLCCGQHDRI